MRNKPIYPRRVLCLPPDYAVWVQAAAEYARCSPEDVVCLACANGCACRTASISPAKSPALSLPAEIREKKPP